jgi:hypothetical protein
MGWMSELPGHEGWPVALQRDEKQGLARDEHFRPLSYPLDAEPGLRVDAVQAGCDCGWRSPRRVIPSWWAKWFPFTVEVPDHIENDLRAEWLAHVAQVTAAPKGEGRCKR